LFSTEIVEFMLRISRTKIFDDSYFINFLFKTEQGVLSYIKKRFLF